MVYGIISVSSIMLSHELSHTQSDGTPWFPPMHLFCFGLALSLVCCALRNFGFQCYPQVCMIS